jgi:hypothetical protein
MSLRKGTRRTRTGRDAADPGIQHDGSFRFARPFASDRLTALSNISMTIDTLSRLRRDSRRACGRMSIGNGGWNSRRQACSCPLLRSHKRTTFIRRDQSYVTYLSTLAKALRANSRAWKFFWELPPTYRRRLLVWIHTAERPETRARRIRESIVLLAAGQKPGWK